MLRKRGVQADQNAPDSLATPLPPDSLHCHWPLFCRHSLLLPLPPAGNRVRFSCSIPRLFVLSRNMSMINTTGKLASFWGIFLSPSAPSLRIHWPLCHRPTPHAGTSGFRSCADPPPWLLPDTDSRIPHELPPPAAEAEDRWFGAGADGDGIISPSPGRDPELAAAAFSTAGSPSRHLTAGLLS